MAFVNLEVFLMRLAYRRQGVGGRKYLDQMGWWVVLLKETGGVLGDGGSPGKAEQVPGIQKSRRSLRSLSKMLALVQEGKGTRKRPVVSVGYLVSARCLHFLMEVFYCSRQTRKNGIEFVPFLRWSGILTCPSRFMSATR